MEELVPKTDDEVVEKDPTKMFGMPLRHWHHGENIEWKYVGGHKTVSLRVCKECGTVLITS